MALKLPQPKTTRKIGLTMPTWVGVTCCGSMPVGRFWKIMAERTCAASIDNDRPITASD